MTTLYGKKKYVAHYTMLAQALDHGLELRKIHRVLEFKRKPWFRPYIEMNTKMREQSKNKFEENFYKLMNNSIYGKCLQEKRKEKDVKACHQVERKIRVGGACSATQIPQQHDSF